MVSSPPSHPGWPGQTQMYKCRFLAVAAQCCMKVMQQSWPEGKEKITPLWKRDTKHTNCPAPHSRFWDTSCLCLPPRRFTEPKHESSLIQSCTAPVSQHQHPVKAGGCRADAPAAWGHLGSSCIRLAPPIHTGWGPNAKKEKSLVVPPSLFGIFLIGCQW